MSTNRMMNLSVGQIKPIQGDPAANLKKMFSMIDQAANAGSDLIIFPELAYTGMFLPPEQLHQLAEPKDGYFVQQLCQKAKEKQIHIIAGYPEKGSEPGQVYNSCIFIDDQGNVIENKRKVYAWGNEKDTFSAGHHFPVVETKFGKIGILICYEMEFPEPARIETLKGAELIVVCAAFTDKAHWDLKLTVNAIFNQVYVIGANSAEGRCIGLSQIVAPDGTILALASEDENLLTQAIDLDKVNDVRQRLPYIRDFRRDTFSLDALNTY